MLSGRVGFETAQWLSMIRRRRLLVRPLGLRDRVFRENFLDSLEGFLGRRLRRHAALDDIHPTLAPCVLVLQLRISRVESPELRHGRTEQTLRGVGRPVRVVEPPMVILHDRGHGGYHSRCDLRRIACGPSHEPGSRCGVRDYGGTIVALYAIDGCGLALV